MKLSDKHKAVTTLLRWITDARTVFCVFLATVILPNVLLSVTESMSPVARVANVLLPLGVYYLLFTLTRRLGLTLWLALPVMVMAGFQLVLLDLYGRSIIAVDMFLNVATTNPGEAGELLGNLKGVVALVIVLYVPLLAWGVYALTKGRSRASTLLPGRWLRRNRRIALAFTTAGVVATVLSFATSSSYRLERDMYPVNISANLVTAVERETRLADYQQTASGFTYHAQPTHPASLREIYVMVIGETSRAANWEMLGYGRPTNPRLSRRRDSLAVYRHAMSESNTTHKSVPMLMTALGSDDFDSLYHTRSIITAMKEAGFKTAFFSNQQRNHSFIDFFGEEADTCVFVRERADIVAGDGDNSLAECLEDIIAHAGGDKLFVVLHAYGSHFNYADRYGRSSRHFRPDDVTDANAANRDRLINAYDNTIVATDAFLDRVLNTLDQASASGAATAMLYTSDHGEDIFDDSRELFLHASPCPTINQLHVPFIAFTGSVYNKLYPQVGKMLREHEQLNISTTACMFHTMLDIAGVSCPCLRRECSLASPACRLGDQPRRYINDHNESVDLAHAGFTATDFAEMTRRGLSR